MQCHVFDQRGEPEPLFGEQSAVTFAGFGDTILHHLTKPFRPGKDKAPKIVTTVSRVFFWRFDEE